MTHFYNLLSYLLSPLLQSIKKALSNHKLEHVISCVQAGEGLASLGESLMLLEVFGEGTD